MVSTGLLAATKIEIGHLYKIVSESRDISEQDRVTLLSALDEKFSGEDGQEHLDIVKDVISSGLFNEISISGITELAYRSFLAVKNGAPQKYVMDLAEVGFDTDISAEQLEMAAKSLDRFNKSEVPKEVYEEIIAHGLYNNWSPDALRECPQAIIDGVNMGLNPQEIALAVTVAIDQKPPEISLSEQIKNALNIVAEKTSEAKRRKKASDAMNKAIQNGVPRQICQEIYYHSVENNWSENSIEAVFDGMTKGQAIGLTPDKTALALVIRIDQGFEEKDIDKIIYEQLEYLKKAEAKKLEILKEEPEIQEVRTSPIPEKYKEKTKISTVRKKGISRELLKQSIETFIGAPYRWGGTSRRGVDCSGFTQTVFREQGITIPRKSTYQFKVGKVVEKNELKYGDMVFFKKNFWGKVNHVGIYVGENKFIHSLGGKGVVISSLNKGYYKTRYAGARRVG